MSKFSRDRVKGFLHTDGRKMVNENGETVVLRGWGVGSWMNPEGFMIGGAAPGSSRIPSAAFLCSWAPCRSIKSTPWPLSSSMALPQNMLS